VVRFAGEISSWNSFVPAIREKLHSVLNNRGAGLRILIETVGSPTLADQLHNFQTQYPDSGWYQYEPLARDSAFAGTEQAFGSALETQYRFKQAEVVLSLDADFLVSGPGWIRYARDFIDRRRVRKGTTRMNRLYVIESTPTNTGAIADHRRLVPAEHVEKLARMLLAGGGDDRWLRAVMRGAAWSSRAKNSRPRYTSWPMR
jgi:hypothetical protein